MNCTKCGVSFTERPLYRKSQLKEDIEHLENRYNKTKSFLEMHGVRICEITELPF